MGGGREGGVGGGASEAVWWRGKYSANFKVISQEPLPMFRCPGSPGFP